MRIEVDIFKDGSKRNEEFNISWIELIKHYSISGYGSESYFTLIPRIFGGYLFYRNYFNLESLKENKFSKPKDILYDPTEIGQFSNLTGKAFADFLAKKIDGASHTIVYEGYLKDKSGTLNQGESRCDLIGFTKDKKIFTIEAKGYSKRTAGNIKKIKDQAVPKNSLVVANFSVGCVTYNIFEKVKCKYHDPILSDAPFNESLFKELTKSYYSRFEDFINNKSIDFNIVSISYNGSSKSFYEINIGHLFEEKIYLLFNYSGMVMKKKNGGLFLLITEKINDFIVDGFDVKPDELQYEYLSKEENIFIDSDGIGFSFFSLKGD